MINQYSLILVTLLFKNLYYIDIVRFPWATSMILRVLFCLNILENVFSLLLYNIIKCIGTGHGQQPRSVFSSKSSQTYAVGINTHLITGDCQMVSKNNRNMIKGRLKEDHSCLNIHVLKVRSVEAELLKSLGSVVKTVAPVSSNYFGNTPKSVGTRLILACSSGRS